MDELSCLARAAGGGDRAALDRLVRSTYDQVWRYCSALVDPDRADDLAQDTFARAVRSIGGYRGESSAKTWLLGVARHVCLDEIRSKQRRARRDEAARGQRRFAGPDASEGVVVADLLQQLPAARREAFVLTQMLGLPYEEAARVAGCPVGTIRSRVARAREDLADLHRPAQAAITARVPLPPASGQSPAS